MSTTNDSTPAAAVNPFDTRRIDGADFEVYDTRTSAVVNVCIRGGDNAQAEADRLWHAELLAFDAAADAAHEAALAHLTANDDAEVIRPEDHDAAPILNALGEPMPASEAEALARQLVHELNEMEVLGQVGAQLDRYDAKSAQVRALGFDIGPADDGTLCLYDWQAQRPLAAPAQKRVVAVITSGPAFEAAPRVGLLGRPLAVAAFHALYAEAA